jgi:16S rRNA (adenine1518-N6/adenine1519-N6)-dimethyltransferase
MILLNTIKRELGALGIKPKKSLGQNFLINEGVYKKIVTALEIKEGNIIVEIGPGLGTLTGYLAESGAKIIAIEKDGRLAKYLENKFVNSKNVTIKEGDILKFPHARYKIQDTKYKVVGNIPYYLTSHLIRMVFEKWPRPEKIVLMIQKEVAQRIVARPPRMSLLAVSVQYYAKPEIVSYVSKKSFWPAPEVNSAIVKLETSNERQTTKDEKEKFFKTVKAGFRGKRKQLINNLAAGLGIKKEKIKEKLLSVGVDYHRRAETLTTEEWQKITEVFFWPRSIFLN